MIRTIAAKLPTSIQSDCRRWLYRWQIVRGNFRSPEADFRALGELVNPSDIVIDVGANIGHYTIRLAQLVGPSGRVIALEPVTETFQILSSNVAAAGVRNVTLLNTAASAQLSRAQIATPTYSNGMPNYYQASLGSHGDAVLCMPLDALDYGRVRLIKIDAEGHEMAVLNGAERLISQYHPTIIIESDRCRQWLIGHGYRLRRIEGSPNWIAEH